MIMAKILFFIGAMVVCGSAFAVGDPVIVLYFFGEILALVLTLFYIFIFSFR